MSIGRYFLKLCGIYVGLWAATLGLINFDYLLPSGGLDKIFPFMLASIIFFPPIAIGLFYNRLFEMGRWLISSTLALLAAITTTIIFFMSANDPYAILAFIILGVPISLIISVSTVIIASLMKQQKKVTRLLGFATLYSAGTSGTCLLLMAIIQNTEALLYPSVGACIITIGLAALTLTINSNNGLKTPPCHTRGMVCS